MKGSVGDYSWKLLGALRTHFMRPALPLDIPLLPKKSKSTSNQGL